MDEVVPRLSALEAQVKELENEIEVMLAQSGTTNTLIKFVILPLIIILGALVGVKVAFPMGL